MVSWIRASRSGRTSSGMWLVGWDVGMATEERVIHELRRHAGAAFALDADHRPVDVQIAAEAGELGVVALKFIGVEAAPAHVPARVPEHGALLPHQLPAERTHRRGRDLTHVRSSCRKEIARSAPNRLSMPGCSTWCSPGTG